MKVERNTVLVIGSTGKTGRRVAERLRAQGVEVRAGSRSADPAFDWSDPGTWDACLAGVGAVYVTYAPDLAMPGAPDAIRSFVVRAKQAEVERLVLLSGRGEPEAQACEAIVQKSGIPSTVVRASWFNQNFSEGAFTPMIMAGHLATSAGEVREPFVDVNDIADVAVAALTQDGHGGKLYEVTGPRLLTFAEAVGELSAATGQDVRYEQIPHADFVGGVRASGAPEDVAYMIDYLFATVLDGRNEHVCDGVQEALGRPARDFSEFARDLAAGLTRAAT
ncbi:MAG: NAD(P)H-binding protein [Planctomycetes bacterium]|nr:NAD(P)H-binding protein [Planctomycetota bacterium]